jgi:hypothetical protein
MAKEFDVAVQIKIYVDEPSKSASVKGAIEKLAKVQKFWEEDVGFGIKALKALLLMCDSGNNIYWRSKYSKMDFDLSKLHWHKLLDWRRIFWRSSGKTKYHDHLHHNLWWTNQEQDDSGEEKAVVYGELVRFTPSWTRLNLVRN